MTFVKRAIAVLSAVAALLAVALASPAASLAAGSAGEGPVTPTLQTTSPTPTVGATITVIGSGYAAKEKVTLTLHTKTYALGSVKTDKNGAFSKAVTLPAKVTGSHTIVGDGATGDTASTGVLISAGTVVTTSTLGVDGNSLQSSSLGTDASSLSSSSSLLSSTGVAIASYVGVAVVLLLAGGFLVLGGRRKKTS